MKLSLFTLLALSFSFNSFASLMKIDNSDFKCSDGKTYDVLRHYASLGNNLGGTWDFMGLCEQGTLKQDLYEGKIYDANWEQDITMAHTEVQSCIDQEMTPEVKKCEYEFIINNGYGGMQFPDIQHHDGTKGATCGDRLSRAKYKIQYFEDGLQNLKNNSDTALSHLFTPEKINTAKREYGHVVRDCQDEKQPQSQRAVSNSASSINKD